MTRRVFAGCAGRGFGLFALQGHDPIAVAKSPLDQQTSHTVLIAQCFNCAFRFRMVEQRMPSWIGHS